jgi:hypothetical protein
VTEAGDYGPSHPGWKTRVRAEGQVNIANKDEDPNNKNGQDRGSIRRQGGRGWPSILPGFFQPPTSAIMHLCTSHPVTSMYGHCEPSAGNTGGGSREPGTITARFIPGADTSFLEDLGISIGDCSHRGGRMTGPFEGRGSSLGNQDGFFKRHKGGRPEFHQRGSGFHQRESGDGSREPGLERTRGGWAGGGRSDRGLGNSTCPRVESRRGSDQRNRGHRMCKVNIQFQS